MTLFGLGILSPCICYIFIYGDFIEKITKRISDAEAEQSEMAQESFSNIRTIKVFASEDS